MNRLINSKALVALVLLVLIVLVTLRNTGVREVNRAKESVNFAMMDARPAPGDWPWFRGISQTNTAPFDSTPAQWLPGGSNNGWVTPISGRGRTALCIWGENVFLPVVDVARESISLACLDHLSGRLRWQTELHRGGILPLPARSSQVSTTPACDGTHVYLTSAVNGGLWVTAIDLTGRIAWSREAGPYFSKWGYGSSPAIYKSLVIVAADNKGARINRLVGTSHLTALHRQTGEVVWRVLRPEADSFGTPIVARVAGRDQLLITGKDQVASYDPLTGKMLWSCRWSANRVANSVAFDEHHVYASTRFPQQELLCIRADGSGDVTNTHMVWQSNKSAGEELSPVVHDGRLYTITEDGVLACLDATTGQPQWKRRLGGTISASPVIAGHHLYCCNEEGTVFVIRLGGRGELVAEIPISEGIFAAPIVSQNRLFLRTLANVHCVTSSDDVPLAVQPEPPRRRM